MRSGRKERKPRIEQSDQESATNNRVGGQSYPAPRLKRSRGTMIQLRKERMAESGKKALASAFVLVAMSASFLLADQQPAHAVDFTVTNTNDDGVGSLRAAIVAANAASGPDTVKFDISGSGVKTIKPDSELPPLFDGTSIDGYSQLGSFENSINYPGSATSAQPLIQLDGSDAGSISDGLQIFGSNLTVKGLVINRFGSSGIDIEDQLGPGNDAANVSVKGNFIGTDPTGTQDLGNGFAGVYVNGAGFAFIGGSQLADRNLISGNGADGVLVEADNSLIQRNLIGLNKDGAVLGNSRDGVRVDDGEGNLIKQNAISFNGGLGIDLNGDGITANDAGDPDSGPNGLQNKPVIGRATTGGAGTTIKGSLDSTPSKTFTLEFYANPAGQNEGLFLLGEQSVTTDASGKATFTFKPQMKVPRGFLVTATATGPSDFFGNTSEFSAAKKVVKPR